MERMRRNLNIIFLALILMLIALAVRLFWIQVIGQEDLKQAACSQSLVSLDGVNTRGLICDRNGEPLVGDHKQYLYVIRKKNLDYQAAKLLKSLQAKQTGGSSREYYVYASRHYKKAAGEKLVQKYDAYILQASARYCEDQPAAGLIGYVNRRDSSGAAGLELMCDKELSQSTCRLYAAADVAGNLLPGRGLITEGVASKKGEASRHDVKTTLDKPLQEAVEDIIREYPQDCAVVILDQSTGGILTMAYTPSFDPSAVEQYVESDSDALLNKATQGEYAPGSVFKIVVAAVALEKGIPADQTFVCTGSAHVGNIDIGCKTGGTSGHGEIDMKEAFAQSCNSYFVQLGETTGAEDICRMAKRFGFGKKALGAYPQQCCGHVMTTRECSGAGVGNLSIGQGQMLVTPLQIARMTSIIATGGIDRGTHILLSERSGETRVVSVQTASQIREMMEKVTETGTASRLGLTEENGKAAAAVKTGTAQYGKREENKSYGWLTGFTPCQDPQYVITVFAGGKDTSAADAGPVYRKILAYLRSSGSY